MTTWRRDPRALWRSTPAGTVVVLGATAAEATSLSGTAADVWFALDAPRTAGDLAERFAEVYDTEPDVVLRDVEAFLASLAAIGAATMA
jgi:hypothetical protein